jgi:hypothetical protein
VTTPQASNTTESTQTTEAAVPKEPSFPEYVAARRAGKPVVSEAPSASAEVPAAQKQSTESDTEETEAKDESEEAEADGDESKDDEQEAKDDAKDDAKDGKPRKSGWQRRIDKLNARNSAAEQRALAAEAELARMRSGDSSKAKPVESPKATDDSSKPVPDSFETYAEYTEALTDWKIEQREKVAKAEATKSQLEAEQKNVVKAHAERVKSFMEKTTDFMEALENVDDIPYSAAFEKEIVTSETGPELMYALAKDRAEYERLQKLGPTAVARELGKLEATLAAAKTSEEKKPEPKKTTQAPKPPSPVGKSTASPVAKSLDDPSLSFSEYVRLRREHQKRKNA